MLRILYLLSLTHTRPLAPASYRAAECEPTPTCHHRSDNMIFWLQRSISRSAIVCLSVCESKSWNVQVPEAFWRFLELPEPSQRFMKVQGRLREGSGKVPDSWTFPKVHEGSAKAQGRFLIPEGSWWFREGSWRFLTVHELIILVICFQ